MFKSYDMNEFGIYLRNLRKSLNMTQKGVEKKVRVSSETLRKIEAGMVIPRYETLEYLSQVYRSDILKVFSKYRISSELFEFHKILDRILLENKVDKINDLIIELESNISEEVKSNLINYIEYTQFKSIVEGLKVFYLEDKKTGEDNFLKAIQLTIPEFTFDKAHLFKYSYLEQRILMLSALAFCEIKAYKTSEYLLKIALEQALAEFTEVRDRFLIVKLYYNLSYTYRGMGVYELSIAYADEGIQFCLENYINYLLPQLFYRRGIAKFVSNKADYKLDLKHAVNLLEAFNELRLAEIFRKTTLKKYKITI